MAVHARDEIGISAISAACPSRRSCASETDLDPVYLASHLVVNTTVDLTYIKNDA